MKYIYLFVFCTLLSSCQDDLTPSWLEVNSIDFITNVTVEGVNTHDIVDGWVYLDNKSLGVWEIPFRMPILEEGDHELKIYAGIKTNGISDTRTDYKFYKSYTQTISLTKEKTTEIKPVFKYKDGVIFEGKEDFEDTGTILNPDIDLDTTKIKIISKTDFPDIVKYGNNCGRIKLSSADTIVKVITNLNILIPSDRVYLEVDYFSTNSFTVAILDETSVVSNDIGAFGGANSNPEKWKKIYFDITEYVHRNPNSTHFDYYILAILDKDKSESFIYFDNLKIVHF